MKQALMAKTGALLIAGLITGLIAGISLLCSSTALSRETVEDKGAENIRIKAGKMNDVHFPHHRHQAVVKDCAVCHDLFPKQAHSISTLKTRGELKKRQVMDKHCIACHRKMKSAGETTGPTTCGKCHHA